MRKVNTTQSTSPSPALGSVSGSAALSGQPQRETLATGSRAPSRQVSQQKDIPLRGMDRTPTRRPTGYLIPPRDRTHLTLTAAPENRRTSFTSTTATNLTPGSRDPTRTGTPTIEDKEPRWDSFGRRPSAVRREQPPVASLPRSPPLEEEPLSSSSPEESGSDEEDTTRRAPLFKRFGKFSTQRSGLRDDEDNEEDTPAFLPLAREHEHTHHERPVQELSTTLRLDAERAAAQRRHPEQRAGPRAPVPTDSSTSSMSSGGRSSLPDGARPTSQGAPVLSPQSAAERQNSRKSTASGREASDGTPSMGSSFSDLDGMCPNPEDSGFQLIDWSDASVTQSALEEALLSNMQHGGMASRMSTISHALRSRYLQ
ncbi:Autophagy-related protein [Penicillium chrysogenum]|uniref:Autophagy-related protein n=1 Tax=Penicillium chrysogenum TaxID=5076 RepID=A0A161XXD2_PENCH|nr:Autophagy-related protein [Penicillium chrysogenum]